MDAHFTKCRIQLGTITSGRGLSNTFAHAVVVVDVARAPLVVDAHIACALGECGTARLCLRRGQQRNRCPGGQTPGGGGRLLSTDDTQRDVLAERRAEERIRSESVLERRVSRRKLTSKLKVAVATGDRSEA